MFQERIREGELSLVDLKNIFLVSDSRIRNSFLGSPPMTYGERSFFPSG